MKKMRSDKCNEGVFESFCLLMKACSVGGQNWGTLVPIFRDLGAFLRHILFHIGTFHPMLGLSWGFSWRYVGSDWGRGIYVEGFAAVILHFCGAMLRDVCPLGCLFLCCCSAFRVFPKWFADFAAGTAPCALRCSLSLSLTFTLTHSLTHPPTHPRTHSPTHSHSHSH